MNTLSEFLDAATQAHLNNERCNDWILPIENNYHANVVMLTDAYAAAGGCTPEQLYSLHIEAEKGCIQVALLNRGLNPGSVFISKAHKQGWRWISGEFRKV